LDIKFVRVAKDLALEVFGGHERKLKIFCTNFVNVCHSDINVLDAVIPPEAKDWALEAHPSF